VTLCLTGVALRGAIRKLMLDAAVTGHMEKLSDFNEKINPQDACIYVY